MAIYAKFVLDKSIALNKKVWLQICVDKKINVPMLIKLMPKGSTYERSVKAIEVVVGKIEWPDEENENE